MPDEHEALLQKREVVDFTFFEEVWSLLMRTVPIFLSRSAWVVMKTTDSALLGHTGTRYLAASSLSDLWTMTTGVFMKDQVLGILCSQANGAKRYEMVGIWFQVSMTVVSIISVPVAISWWCTSPVLQFFSQPKSLASDAATYAILLSLCIPGKVLFTDLTHVLQSQSMLRPSVVAATAAMVFNVVFGFLFVIVLGYGFVACPLVTVCAELFQTVIILGYYIWYKQIAASCWPTTSFWDNVTRERLGSYIRLFMPAALQIGSDFWRMATVGGFAAAISDIDVAVFNASYRILWIALAFIGSLAKATSIDVGHHLGAGHPRAARYAAICGITAAAVIAVSLSLVTLFFSHRLGGLFSSDPEIIQTFTDIRYPLSFTVIFMTMSVMLETIPMSTGDTYSVFVSGFIASCLGCQTHKPH
eukprot:TRINITY_DN18972_c0_g1_i1.p1 TRINITY_DN18972_c0_g1~~TRINITY_DN18972_c0_g1_i1.p1  ORF type:complete len:416 (+),score=48.55 TRINITY_DN18972_c0_g1_i1:51-1298(+)